jgi:hypothetical protein
MDVLVLEELDDLAEMAYLDPADGITPLRELRKGFSLVRGGKDLEAFLLGRLGELDGEIAIPGYDPYFLHGSFILFCRPRSDGGPLFLTSSLPSWSSS